MKRIPSSLFAGLFSLCLFTSCQKDADISNTPDSPINTDIPAGMSANINGNDWTASSLKGIDMGNVIWLIGSTSNGNTNVTLRLPIDVQPGTYTFPTNDPDTFNALYTYSAITTYGAKTGKIVVTKHDVATGTLQGTFEFGGQSLFGTATVAIASGKFNMTYQ